MKRKEPIITTSTLTHNMNNGEEKKTKKEKTQPEIREQEKD
jgi:hypothetical protein